jgi:1,4-alpha-glucan branching enzyme
MIQTIRHSQIYNDRPKSLYNDNERQILIFSRSDYIFAFNFNPFNSYADFKFQAPSGKYKVVLSSDSSRFGGFDRVSEKTEHLTLPSNGGALLSIYLPSRAAIVLKKES